jgi:predicted RNase H-like HicB family nuclease
MNSQHYEMTIWWSEENHSYVVDVPKLSCGLAHGSTRQRAIRHAEESIQAWLKTARRGRQKIPQPRTRPAYAWLL